MSGWIKLHRKLRRWEWYTDTPAKSLFLHLLIDVNREDGSHRGVKVLRGQTITGRMKLSAETGLSQQQIRTALDKLVSTNDITIKATKTHSIITVCNYDDYQHKEDIEQPTEQPTLQPADQPAEQPLTRSKERKKFIAPTQKQVDDYCKERNRGVDSTRWFNYYTANGWMVGKNKMKDWKAAVRTWEKDEAPKKPSVKKFDDI
jgi:hypothetical protein